MNFSRFTAIFCCIYFLCFFSVAQTLNGADELKADISRSTVDDTVKVKKLIMLANQLSGSEFKNSIVYSGEALSISQTLHYTTGITMAYNSMADAYWYHSDYEKAQQYYFKAYRINDSIQNKAGIAFSLYNIGWIVCIQQQNYKQDSYLYKAMALYKELNDTSGLMKIYNALASYYSDRFNKSKSKQYFDSSIVYFRKGIDIAKKGNKFADMGRIYGNMGDLFYFGGDYKSANFYNEKSLEIHRKINDSLSITIGYLNIGLSDLELNQIESAISKLKFVYDYNVRHDLKDTRLQAMKGLARAYYKKGEFREAYDQYEEYVALKSDLDKEAYSISINNLQSSYSLEKSEAKVDQLKQTNEIQELKNKKNTYFIFILLGVALIVIVAAVLLFRQNRQKQLINIQLQHQNQVIAEKKLEIDNSIQYAKGIQQAILPVMEELTEEFGESFIYYKPKDVVSGDFYWFGKAGTDFYCIAADCTGHGVPGALMSIIGIDKLVQALYEKQITSPGKILSFLNLQVKQVLKQHSDTSKQKDGMDLAVLKFNEARQEVSYSAANRPLYLIRNNELIEYHPDKVAIGGYTADDQEFKTITIPLLKNDSLYIFTDGYADQFGGSEGKKFMSKNLKKLLVSVSALPAKEQYARIEHEFLTWKSTYEQVDDVLLIGIKI